MSNSEHLAILNQGIEVWNKWRETNPRETPDLRNEDLSESNLNNVNFIDAKLSGVKLKNAHLCKANFSNADLRGANLSGAKIVGTNFSNTDLSKADFTSAYAVDNIPNCSDNVKFTNSTIKGTNFFKAKLNNADFTKAKAGLKTFTLGNIIIIIVSFFIAFWSAYSVLIVLSFSLYFFFNKYYKKRLVLWLLGIGILSIIWAIFIRLYLMDSDNFINLHVGVGTGMIAFTIFCEYIVIKLTKPHQTFDTELLIAVMMIFLLIYCIIFPPEPIFNILEKLPGINMIIQESWEPGKVGKALFGAVAGAFYGFWVSYSAITGKHFEWLWRLYVENLVINNILTEETYFKQSNLTDAVFNSSILTGSNFTNAFIEKTSWWDIDDLECIVFGKTYLRYPQIRRIFQYPLREQIETDNLKLDGLNLEGINFAQKDLSGASFIGTNLSKSNLSRSILNNANLTEANLNGANLTKASLNSTCLKDFNYDEETIFKDVECTYLESGNSRRSIDLRLSLPSRNLKPGDFENFFNQEDNIRLLIRNTDNLQAIDSALSQIIQNYKIKPNFFRGIIRIGDYFLVEFQVPPNIDNINKSLVEQNFENDVEQSISTNEKDKSTLTPETIIYMVGNTFYQNRNMRITGETFITGGSGTFNLGDISGTVANAINQLSTSPNTDQPGIRELLGQLKEAIEAENSLEDVDKSDALEEIRNLATSSQDDDKNTKKIKAGKSLRNLARIANSLSPAATLVTIFKEVLPKIAHFFEL